jgi:hypothetical protein
MVAPEEGPGGHRLIPPAMIIIITIMEIVLLKVFNFEFPETVHGPLPSEWVALIAWNRWPASPGIGGSHPAEYAPPFSFLGNGVLRDLPEATAPGPRTLRQAEPERSEGHVAVADDMPS